MARYDITLFRFCRRHYSTRTLRGHTPRAPMPMLTPILRHRSAIFRRRHCFRRLMPLAPCLRCRLFTPFAAMLTPYCARARFTLFHCLRRLAAADARLMSPRFCFSRARAYYAATRRAALVLRSVRAARCGAATFAASCRLYALRAVAMMAVWCYVCSDALRLTQARYVMTAQRDALPRRSIEDTS